MPVEQAESGTAAPEEGHLFAGYETDPAFYDEMFDADGAPRAHCRELWAALGETPRDELATMQERAERSFLHEGITFSVYGEEGAQERIIPIDIVPRIVDAEQWDLLERGLRQRLEALNLFLADIYGPGRVIADGVIPADMVRGCPQFRNAMRGVDVPHGAYVSVCGTDLVRTHDGFLVLEDNLRVPSGVSYMLANRAAVKTSLRDAFRRHRVRGIENYGRLLRRTLAELSPRGDSDPTIVLLTPGVYNSAFYEHMFLARETGVELVQGGDLVARNGFVYMRTTGGLRRVDVIYRRIDDDFLDPLTFRPDSMLGTPGLFNAYRLGNVAIANAPGTGVADDKSVYAYVPDIIRYFLNEEPLLANVETHLCRDPDGLEYTLDNLDKLVVKEVGGSGGYGMLVGPHATAEERGAFAEKIRATPENYISQPTLDLSRAPCLTEDGAAPRHVDLRPFVLRGQETRLVPGAFCRVALTPGSLVVNSSQGGGGKDLWVLSG
ncbi:MAG: circularly permuted type 2 ATP-grasp protein [Rhodospirillaceae bacterium]|nr:circularly permuted type 2 ATP-grasp protein [Rhodospirillaceae bacterium]